VSHIIEEVEGCLFVGLEEFFKRRRIWEGAHEDKWLELREVKTGLINGDLVEVRDNLKPGELVVIKGNLFIDRAASGT